MRKWRCLRPSMQSSKRARFGVRVGVHVFVSPIGYRNRSKLSICPTVQAEGPYYCGVGADKAFGRDIVDSHYKACIYAGINISGINGEVMPGQWEFQVGPAVGISAGDEVWVARYILERITEIAGAVLSLDPKPVLGDWNGAGAHTNYSTKSMGSDGGIDVIKKTIEKLGLGHKEHIVAYGKGNERRLTGHHETADINTFSWGVANRGASVRVGRDTEKAGKGNEIDLFLTEMSSLPRFYKVVTDGNVERSGKKNIVIFV